MIHLDEAEQELLQHFTDEERKALDSLLLNDPVLWRPLPGPQTMAYYSTADVVGYGGAAGGGKTDLAVGKALTQHRKIAVFRRIGTELTAIVDRFTELLGGTHGYNGQQKIWRNPIPGVQLEFGSVPNPGDEKGHQGRPKDLLVLDEAANLLESQARFLMGWVRSTIKGQRTQTLMCFNPPTEAEGRWIVEFFKPWLDKMHPKPAMPGELRYFAAIDGRDVEVPGPERFVLDADKQRVYAFDPKKYKAVEIITPQSRTFIPSSIADNPYLFGTGYMTQLQALPEPLRSQMLYGDFHAGMQDDEWQVIPTAWVQAAMARWKPLDVVPPMDQMGVDVARGGKDNTIIARRHGNWFAKSLLYPGKDTPDGPTIAGLVIAARRDNAPVNIDVIGVGSSPYDFLRDMKVQVLGVNVSEASGSADKSGILGFFNLRSELYWKFREGLDPANNKGWALHPDPQLLADLCAPKWSVQARKIKVESREDIIKRIGRSPDWASAHILAAMDAPKVGLLKALRDAGMVKEYDPYKSIGALTRQGHDYDPYK